MTRTQLAQLPALAAAMKAELAAHAGLAQRSFGPYTLILFNRNGSLRLHIGLVDRWPALEECAPIAEAFAVPFEDSEPTGETYTLESKLRGAPRLRLKTLRYAWTETLAPQAQDVPVARQLTFFGKADGFSREALSSGL
jgi:hypothetical protein